MALRWYTWALVVTSSGIVDTGILATTFETSRYVHGTGHDESSATVGCSTANVAAVAGKDGNAAGKRSSERENALQAQLAELLDRRNRITAESERTEVEHEVPKRHRAFIESRAFSKLTNLTPGQHRGRTGRSSSRTWPQL